MPWFGLCHLVTFGEVAGDGEEDLSPPADLIRGLTQSICIFSEENEQI